jgi:hypothetical protein
MLRALTGVLAAIFGRAKAGRRSGRMVWAELPDWSRDRRAPPGAKVAHRFSDWAAFPPNLVRLVESNGDRVDEIANVRKVEMTVSARGESAIRMTFLDGAAPRGDPPARS